MGPTLFSGRDLLQASQRRAPARRLLAALGFVSLLLISCAAPAAGPTATPSTPRRTSTGGGTVTKTTTASVKIVKASARPLQKIVRVEVVPGDLELATGESAVLGAVAYDEQNQRVSLVRFTWSTVNIEAGRVDQRGRFTAGTTPGTYKGAIQVTAVRQTPEQTVYQSGLVDVTITGETIRPALSRIDVAPNPIQATPGQIVRLEAYGYDAQGHLVADTRFTWSLGEPVGKINQLGYLTVEGQPGTYTKAISVEGRSGDRTLALDVDLEIGESSSPVEALTVQILPRQIQIAPGEVFRFNAVAFDQKGRAVPQRFLRWSVARTAAGTISPEGGFGNFRAGTTPGTYVDTVVVDVSSLSGRQQLRATGYATVVVQTAQPPRPLSLARVQPGSIAVQPGQTAILTPLAYDDAGKPAKNVEVTWEMADPRAGRIGKDGRFVATATPGRYPGAVRLTVTQRLGDRAHTQTAHADVNVPGDVARVEITPSQAVAAAGETIHFSAVAFDTQGSQIPGLIFRWRVANPQAGTIDPLGNFKAGQTLGDYANAIEVTAVQRRPR